MVNPEVIQLEGQIRKCDLFESCLAAAGQPIELSQIGAGDPRRGSHDAKILIVTEAPDRRSATGSAYRGATGTRIMKMFLRTEYGICVDYPDYGREGLIAFLRDMRIYQTSAVKCMLAGEPSALGEQVIANCRKRFLDKQIELLADIELILPMGRMAIASVFHVPLTSVDLRSLIGRPGAGILERDPHYRKMIVGLPHPSGNNRQFNPPLIHEGERLADVKFKASFVRALNGIRVKLEKMGYPLRKIPRGRVEGPLDRY